MINKKHILAAAAGILLFDGFALTAVRNYANREAENRQPSICLNDYQTAPDTVVSVDDLCCCENIPRMYITSANWQDGDPDLPVITDDKQAILVGDRCGVMEVTLASNPDWIMPNNTVTVTVQNPS